MIRTWTLSACLFCVLATIVLARQGVIATNDGRTIQGDIKPSADGQTFDITVHGGTVTLSRDEVASVNYSTDVAGEFHKHLSALDPGDITGRLKLSRDELDAKQYDLAAEAANDVQRLDPHNPEAATLLDTIQSQRMLEARLAGESDPDTTNPSSGSTTNPSAGQYLTMDDVYTIRRFELTDSDNIRVSFFNDVRKRYTAAHDDAANFQSETPAQQALDIFQTGDSKLIKDVRLDSDPQVLADFRSRIQPRLDVNCVSCHSGNGAGGFVLFPGAREATVVYTNYYILNEVGWKVQGKDMFGSGPVYRRMVDRVRPVDSLLLQYGLPRSIAATPHPDVKDFKPMFRDASDPAYTDLFKWISALKPLPPDYGISYVIPTGAASATTQPQQETQGQ